MLETSMSRKADASHKSNPDGDFKTGKREMKGLITDGEIKDERTRSVITLCLSVLFCSINNNILTSFYPVLYRYGSGNKKQKLDGGRRAVTTMAEIPRSGLLEHKPARPDMSASVDENSSQSSSSETRPKEVSCSNNCENSVTKQSSSVDLSLDYFIDIEKAQYTFPERLMELLMNGTVKKAMWWLPGGEAFALVPNTFYDIVLSKYFQGTKFESFTRKLNRW